MKEIFIKYNPYKVETEIKVDGKEIKSNSALNVGEKRLQEWIEELPQILVDELNTKSFKIKFHGTILDYEDLISICEDAKKSGIKIECEHIPAKEVKDKEMYIKEIFSKIQKGPFDELKQDDVKNAFSKALSSDFEVNVVATMSAGKSTLINALMGKKLMPAKQEACTAIITKIKDNDLNSFEAYTYDSKGKLLEVYTDLDYNTMNNLNNNKDIYKIEIDSDIPFVDAKDTSLVLVDTPGPNNSRDPEHKATTYRMMSESSKALVIYILNATQLGVNDDNELLNYVSESMKVGGKQSKDRFIFVINKLDNYKQGDDSVESAINKVRSYLEDKGIKNPNIFPAAALPALDIRTTLKDIDISKINPWDDSLDPNIEEAYNQLRKLNRNKELHLETYSSLPLSIRNKINLMLLKANEENDKKTEALIHTGIIPIELAIKLYVDKYANTSKIKNIVDTFSKKLESAESFEKTKKEISDNQDKKDEILKQITTIKSKLRSGEEAKKFKEKINEIDYTEVITSGVGKIIDESQKKIRDSYSDIKLKLSIEEANNKCKEFNRFSKDIQTEVQVKLEEIINKNIKDNEEKLLKEYKQKISDLEQDIEIGTINIDPYKILNGDIENMSSLVEKMAKVEEVKTGEEWVENTSKKWYKPWTWFQESGYYRDIYEKKQYIEGKELGARFFAPIQKQLIINRDNAIKYAKEQSIEVRTAFEKKFEELDEVLNKKLDELEVCISDSKDVERKLNESKKRLEWIEKIQSQIKSILDI